MSDFMGKKINMFLLMMVILVLIGMGVLSIFFQHSFKSLNTQFENTSSTLGSCQSELVQTSQALTLAQKSLNSTTTDIRKYDTLYEQKANELESKKTDLAKAQAELNKATVLKETYKRQVDEYFAAVTKLNNTITKLNQNITIMKNQLDIWQERSSCLLSTDDGEESECY